MRDITRVVALAHDGTQIERAREDLSLRGIRAHLRHPADGTYVLADETLRADVDAGERGILLGLLIGAAVGLAVVLAVPAVRAWDLTWQLLLIAGVAVQGTIPAIMWRVGRSDRDDPPVVTRHLDSSDWVLVVDDPEDTARAHRVVREHGLAVLDDPSEVLG